MSLATLVSSIKQAIMRKSLNVKLCKTNLNQRVLSLMYLNGLIKGFTVLDNKTINVNLAIDKSGVSLLKDIKLISKPGCKIYIKNKFLVYKNFDALILSSSNGLQFIKLSKSNLIKNLQGGEVLVGILY